MSDHPPTNATPVQSALRMSPTMGAIACALAQAQGRFSNPAKDKTAKVVMKNGGSYTFDYADLGSVLDVVRVPLSEARIAMVQGADVEYHTADRPIALVRVTTRLIHESGEWIENEVAVVVDEQRPQVVASGITYGKRYGIQAMLGIVAEEDDDGNAASGNERAIASRAPARTQQATQQATIPASSSASPMKAKYEAILASLSHKLGTDEAEHQVSAIKARCGTNYPKALAEMKALDESTPAPKG